MLAEYFLSTTHAMLLPIVNGLNVVIVLALGIVSKANVPLPVELGEPYLNISALELALNFLVPSGLCGITVVPLKTVVPAHNCMFLLFS